ncbi:caspase-1 [Octopus bimaculoides]|nr:caspase-1 [Octopus bimaculoides]|eukprot:XP_014782016.1 PREDICTED: caspase-1-like [Octopus bimaculoides]
MAAGSANVGTGVQSSTGDDLNKYFAEYDMKDKTRVAYIVDSECLSNDAIDFGRALKRIGFKYVTISNIYEMMCKDWKKFNEDKRYGNIGCFVFVIINYDLKNDGFDEVALISNLTADKGPSLAGVPKLIFIEPSRVDRGRHKTDGPEPEPTQRKIPITADLLVFRSWWNEFLPISGGHGDSPFMKTLSNVFIKYGTEYEIMKLLTAVSNYIASCKFQSSDNSENNGCKQITRIMSTLLKKLKFEPRN